MKLPAEEAAMVRALGLEPGEGWRIMLDCPVGLTTTHLLSHDEQGLVIMNHAKIVRVRASDRTRKGYTQPGYMLGGPRGEALARAIESRR